MTRRTETHSIHTRTRILLTVCTLAAAALLPPILTSGCASTPCLDRVVSLPEEITIRVDATRSFQRKTGAFTCEVTEARCAILSTGEDRDVALRLSFLPSHPRAALFAPGAHLQIIFNTDGGVTVDVDPDSPEFAIRLSDNTEVKPVGPTPSPPIAGSRKTSRTVPEILLLPPRFTVLVEAITPLSASAGGNRFEWKEVRGIIVEPKSCQHTRVRLSSLPPHEILSAFENGKPTTLSLNGIKAPLPCLLLHGTDSLTMPINRELVTVSR